MKISECSYCGMLAYTDKAMCANCETVLSGEISPAAAEMETNFVSSPPVSDSAAESFSSPPTAEVFQHQTANTDTPRPPRQPRQYIPRSNCMMCKKPIPLSERLCSECSNRKFPAAKFFGTFALLAILAGGFYFYLKFIKNSPSAILAKYASVTGADKAGDFESISLTGKTNFSIRVGINMFRGSAFTNETGTPSKSLEEDGSFEMIVQKPNRSYLEFFKSDPANAAVKTQITYQQAFDGVNGWSYVNMFNQPPRYEDAGNGFSSNKMGMGLSDYESVEFLNDEIKKEYGAENIQRLTSLSTFYVDDVVKITEAKVVVLGKNSRNGKEDAELMVFDEKTGFMLGMIKKESVNDSPVTTIINTNNYKTFRVEGKTSGVSSPIMANRWIIEMEQPAPNGTGQSIFVTIILDIESVKIDVPVDEKIFLKPISKYTGEDKVY